MNLEVAIQGYFFFLFIFIFTNLRGLWEGMILVNGSLRDERNALMQIFFCFEEKKKASFAALQHFTHTPIITWLAS